MIITPAFAQDAAATATDAAAATAATPGIFMSMLPLLLILFVFYVMVIRPQNRRMQEHRDMQKALAKGDKVVTAGGIVGKVTKMLNEDEVLVEIASGVEVSIVRQTIMMKKD